MRLCVTLLLVMQTWLYGEQYAVSIGDIGYVLYTYENSLLLKIDRFARSGKLIYSHSYSYDQNGRLIAENLIGNLGKVEYPSTGIIQSPYYHEICEYDAAGRIIERTQDEEKHTYAYDNLGQLITDQSEEFCVYNSDGDLIQKSDMHLAYNNSLLKKVSLGELEACFEYDSKGNRISKTVNGEKEHYFYFLSHGIGIMDQEGTLKALRIPGLFFQKGMLRAIATPDSIYAPIHDIQGNIVKLIDINTRQEISLNKPDPFGGRLDKNTPIPWIFSGKHFDKEINLVYFGARYYSPELKKWLTHDPAKQTLDPYEYCFNNPFNYFDPNGETSEEVQEHTDNANAALLAGVFHSIGAIGSIMTDNLPLLATEVYFAKEAFGRAYEEYSLVNFYEEAEKMLAEEELAEELACGTGSETQNQ
ncbi:MAG: RHS repeat domain-containing protein [Chlamydiia bacterium]